MSDVASPLPVPGKKINFNVSMRAYEELAEIARQTQRSMTEIVRLGISLAKIAVEAERNGHKLIIVGADGKPLKELVLPS